MAPLHATRYRATAELRQSPGSMLFLAALIALVCGGVLGIAIGARRSATAYDRLIRAGGGPDLTVFPGQASNDNGQALNPTRIRAIRGVRSVAVINGFAATAGQSPADYFSDWNFEALGSSNAQLFTTLMRPIVIQGRLANHDRANEAVVNEHLAHTHHVEVGDSFPTAFFLTPTATKPVVFKFRVTGIVRFPDEIIQGDDARRSLLVTTRAFNKNHATAVAYRGVAIDLDDPATDTSPVRAAITALQPGTPPAYATVANRRSVVRLATDATNATMVVFSVVFGLLGLLVVAQTISRMQRDRLAADNVLFCLGASPATRAATAMIVPIAATALGAIGAAAFSIALSGLFPVGVARRAEVHPGIGVNVAWTLAGTAIAVLIIFQLAFAITWQLLGVAHSRPSSLGPSRHVEWMRRIGLPLWIVHGTRRALAASPAQASTRRGIVTASLAMAGIIALVVFAANTRAVIEHPQRFGWSWNELVKVSEPPNSHLITSTLTQLQANPNVRRVGLLTPLPVQVNGMALPAIAAEATSRPLHVEIARGRAPVGNAQIALGGRTMRRLGVAIGDTVTLGAPSTHKHIQVTVTGQVVLPTAAVVLASDSTTLGYGVYASIATIKRVSNIPQTGVAIDFRPGTDEPTRQAALAPLASALNQGMAMRVSGVQHPDDVVGLQRIGRLPQALAASLALLVMAGLGATLIASTRLRRREVAVFKSLGFVRSQIVGIVLVEAIVASLAAALIGGVIGVALGRTAWLVTAHRLALAPTAVTPVALVAATMIAAVAVTMLVALVPARTAARTPASEILTGE